MNIINISKGTLIALPMLVLAACSSTTDMESQVIEPTPEPVVVEEVVEEVVQEVIEPVVQLSAEELLVQKYGSAILEKTIRFDFDKSTIKAEYTPILFSLANYLVDETDKSITIEGHADEKGTPEYNIALGERRAISVATYLENMGVKSTQISVVSYGEERPASVEHDDNAWSLNRRAELVF